MSAATMEDMVVAAYAPPSTETGNPYPEEPPPEVLWTVMCLAAAIGYFLAKIWFGAP